MKKQAKKTKQTKSVKKQKQEKRTPPSAAPKKSTSKKSETKTTSVSEPALDKIKPKAALDLKDIKAENLRLIQQLEQKNRELEIEASLERVRSRAMAMQSSSELNALISLVYTELTKLDILLDRCFIMIFDETDGATWWMGSRESEHIHKGFYLKPHDYAPHQAYIRAWKAREKQWTYLLGGDTKKVWDDFIFSETELAQLPDFVISNMKSVPRIYLAGSFNNFGCITTAGLEPLSESAFDILIRFAKVFDLTYTRFNDLKQAEAQALKARIEAALERVRSKALAMHTSKELKEVAWELRHQMSLLGQKELEVCAIHLYEGSEDHFESWFAIRPPDDEGAIILDFASFPKSGVKIVDEMIQLYKSGTKEYVLLNEGEEAVEWFEVMKTFAPESYKMVEITLAQVPPAELKAYWSFSDFSGGSLVLVTYAPPDETSRHLLRRAAQVFDLAFRRFMDLKQAEAQARDAQIELSLERVRAKTMAMHNTQDVGNTVATMFQQLVNLGVVTNRCGILIFSENNHAEVWTAKSNSDGHAALIIGQLDTTIHPMLQGVYKAWKEKGSFFHYELKENDIVDYYKAINNYRDYPTRFNLDSLPSYEAHSDFFFPEGAVFAFTSEPVSTETSLIFKRFAGVFGQTYRRYLDLQKAEAQAREAQIEVAVERVRAKALAMHYSEEITGVARILRNELGHLNIEGLFAATIYLKQDDGTVRLWDITIADNIIENGPKSNWDLKVRLEELHPRLFIKMVWASTEKYFVVEQTEQDFPILIEWVRQFKKEDADEIERAIKENNIKQTWFAGVQLEHGRMSIEMLVPPPNEVESILSKIGAAFDLAYKRFLDLQKAETQAREAEIQLALERVRARSLAMHHTSELQDIVDIVAQQLYHIGMDINGGVVIAINDEADEDLPLWASSGAADYVQKVVVPFFDRPIFTDLRNAIKRRNNFFANEYGKEEKDEMFDHLFRYAPWSSITEERKKELLCREGGLTRSAAVSQYSSIAITNHNGKKFSEEEHEILKRFGNVFEQSYTRFLDLQKAEVQAREAQIEVALEKVRSRSLAMHNSNELEQVVGCLFDRLVELGLSFDGTLIFIFDKEKRNIGLWIATNQLPAPIKVDLPYVKEIEHNTIITDLWNAIENDEYIFSRSYSGEIKNDYFRYVAKYNETKVPEPIRQLQIEKESWIAHFAAQKNSILGFDTWSGHVTTDEDFKILIRFSRVFEQAYTRFLDLQKAEAQAGEAQIETALERVRSRSMGMQKSEELKEVIQVVYDQFVHLNIHIEHTGFIMDYKEKDDMHIWLADEHEVPSQVTIPYFDSPHWNSFIEAKEKGTDFFPNRLNFEEKNKFYQDLFMLFPVPEETKEYYFNCPGLAISTVLLDNIGLYIENFSGIPYRDEENNTLMRFGKVFQQTYTRFLDLKKAEAQSREAQIELGLERVRARAMAMQTSEELNALIGTVFNELTRLDLALTRCLIMIYEPATKDARWWMANSEAPETPMNFLVKYHEHAPNLVYMNAWQERTLKLEYILEGKTKKEWDDFLFSETELSLLPDFVIAGMKAPDRVYLNVSFNNFGNLTLASLEPLSNEHFDILLRFARVFDLTYTRFNDLQKAEAQVKEAKIEAALERVRSKTMAMHNSQDVGNTVATMFEQLIQLGVTTNRCGILIFSDTNDTEVWTAKSNLTGDAALIIGYLDVLIHPMLQALRNAWKNKDNFFSYELKGEDITNYYKAINNSPGYPARFNLDGLPAYEVHSDFFFPEGAVFAFTSETISEEGSLIFKRFAGVFGQTYRRYLDLQKAEAQAREAQIEVSLERVRSKAMAMQKSEDLANAVAIIFQELDKLNLGMLRCGIGILNKEKRNAEVWTTTKSDNDTVVHVSGDEPMDIHPLLQGAFDAWLNLSDYSYVLEGEDLNNYYKALTGVNFRLPESQSLITGSEGIQQYYYSAVFSSGSLFAFRETEFPEEAKMVLKRFADVFNLTYTRFNDLKQAEAQAREARIEASLERVRSKAMAMHSSRDLVETIKTFYQQIEVLSTIPRRLGIGIINKESRSVELTTMNSTEKGDSVEIIGSLSLTGHQVLEGIYDHWLAQTEYRPVLMGHELRNYYKIVRPQIPYPDYPTSYAQYGYFFFFPEGGVYAWTEQEMSGDEIQLYRRFTSVLSLTYKRYKDLKEAEAQARESNIQLALERVRARTMAMQRSEELVETSQLLFEEFNKLHLVSLGEFADRAFIGIPDKSHSKVDFWSTDLKGTGINYKFEGSIEEPHLFNRTIQAWKNEEKSIIIDLDGMELASYLDYLKSIGFPVAESHYQRRRIHYFAFFSKGLVGISTAHQLPPETLPLLERFAGVFDLTYTRFLDLQKAEAQVRESKIELALERVRARTMAMQRSEELAEAAEVLFKQFAELGNEPDRISIGIIDEPGGFTDLWATDQQGKQLKILFKARNTEKTTFKKMVAAWRAGKKSTIIDLRDDDLKEWIRYIRNEMGLSIRDEHFNNRRIHQVSFFSQGWLNITTLEPLTDDVLSLLDRFAAVFNLTFTRFLDLKKAEAQTRQAHIETAMEKVRARSLAMQKPEELKEVAQVLRSEMGLLGVEELETCSIYIHDETTGKTNCWYAIKDDKHTEQRLISDYMIMDLKDTWVGRKMLEFYHADQQQTSILMQGEPRKEWIKYCIHKSDLFDDSFYGENIPDRIYHLNKFSNGYLGAASPGEISAESWELLKRATTVFSLAYTRFSDLQKSEANTREAVKQASMDRVRAEIASMRAPADLEKIIPLLWSELTVLGVPFIRCGVFIMDNPVEQIHTYLSTPEGKALAAFDIPYSTPGNISELLNHWRDKKTYLDLWDEEDFKEFAANLVRLGAMSSQEQYLATLPPGGFYLHFLPFLQGMLYVGNLTALQENELNLIQSVADAFSTAYARYEDFNKLEAAKLQVDQALVNLKQAQQQLVQSEKMASLGELTAGIAHEIQNPLNFVNNFSEVNAELIDEIKQAVQSGNNEEVLALAENVKQNLDKINFHGKRADGIVKSMLQHSRSSDQSGKNKKEPTDINVLADEYLRLAYHGLRAKDKAFNATLKTDFDENLGMITVVSQDIARAILNLITNAFYAVQEKSSYLSSGRNREEGAKASEDKNYAPTVSMSTKRLSKNIEIRVKDNGPGIPQQVLDKIFQPFFTTKPTGQGTGLGLSLAYDIVKAHGGELKVITELGIGSEFIIILPIV